MISSKDLCSEIAKALEVDEAQITVETSSTDIEEWDSLGHITILTRLDDMFDNISDRIPQLAEATSVSEIFKLITGAA